jgi:hypothetical protein
MLWVILPVIVLAWVGALAADRRISHPAATPPGRDARPRALNTSRGHPDLARGGGATTADSG